MKNINSGLIWGPAPYPHGAIPLGVGDSNNVVIRLASGNYVLGAASMIKAAPRPVSTVDNCAISVTVDGVVVDMYAMRESYS